MIDDALQLGAHRIGHGVRLRSDITTRADGSLQLGPLARYVYDHQIPLEMAPPCHVHVVAVPDLASHPIGPMLRYAPSGASAVIARCWCAGRVVYAWLCVGIADTYFGL